MLKKLTSQSFLRSAASFELETLEITDENRQEILDTITTLLIKEEIEYIY
jgi:hypothetical protein